MRVSLRYLYSPDLPDIEHNQPPDPEHFCILVQAMIGPEGEEGEESFDFLLCTPSWLAEDLVARPYRWGRFYLLVSRYDFAVVMEAVTEVCSGIEAPDWNSAAAILGRYGSWEFEDYAG